MRRGVNWICDGCGTEISGEAKKELEKAYERIAAKVAEVNKALGTTYKPTDPVICCPTCVKQNKFNSGTWAPISELVSEVDRMLTPQRYRDSKFREWLNMPLSPGQEWSISGENIERGTVDNEST